MIFLPVLPSCLAKAGSSICCGKNAGSQGRFLCFGHFGPGCFPRGAHVVSVSRHLAPLAFWLLRLGAVRCVQAPRSIPSGKIAAVPPLLLLAVRVQLACQVQDDALNHFRAWPASSDGFVPNHSLIADFEFCPFVKLAPMPAHRETSYNTRRQRPSIQRLPVP